MRIVCPVCARQMDLESAKRLAMERLGVLTALAALMAALALLKSGQRAKKSRKSLRILGKGVV
jgi:hypothetical protein